MIWKQLSGGIFDVYELLPAFILALVAGVVGSLLDKPVDQAHLNRLAAIRRTLG